MIKEILQETEEKMKNRIVVLKKDMAGVRAGRATPALLDKVKVDYYGTPTPISQMANISAPEPRSLLIQPWDKGSIPDIEKAIMKSDLGLNPSNDGTIIRLTLPQLTEERRLELVKVVKKMAEEEKVSIRNIRRDANDSLKGFEKSGDIPEDEARRGTDDVQKLTDKYIEEIDRLLVLKEEDILSV